tara:strand:- start:278 stop:481 length:204 start_codon:yes stop_codon:yes gene_type:complete
MKKIRISGIEGYYYIEEDTLIYSCDDTDDVEVSDLTDLTIYQYNRLAKQIKKQYPKYEIDKLEGRFI